MASETASENVTKTTSPPPESSLTKLPSNIDRKCYEFFTISQVCALRRVSYKRQKRVAELLQSVAWDVTHHQDVDPPFEKWLFHLVQAKVNIQSINMVSR